MSDNASPTVRVIPSDHSVHADHNFPLDRADQTMHGPVATLRPGPCVDRSHRCDQIRVDRSQRCDLIRVDRSLCCDLVHVRTGRTVSTWYVLGSVAMR